ncbi:MAG TPA: PAS domain-containing protein [Cyanobacteria bacterium UBA11149]|nr:PAS domain-containing protein [Cyanobacteria bacterium UBA11367]HBE57304.1 PAS domain-containing protein [Cyanobacteria bacterium UBA11366]HBR77239.1 PAS domain-containing protein [Cyanobacteria bacterium UBA11159]HBS67663.1 PAS domain-containing protein [Cyanobacteria bacterium UBA11153]HBW92156.1 PAS domain-containing protein [Cyanobacteria bacterium UBA11149]HCA96144.1 PAS domain-containing protein [Cyanobacteria bacterium UBA9226]
MVSKIATFRLPEQLTQEIRFRAETTGRDRTAVVIDALKQAFGLPPSEPRPSTVEEIQEQLNELEQKYKELSCQLTQLTQTSVLERQISQFTSEMMSDVTNGRVSRHISGEKMVGGGDSGIGEVTTLEIGSGIGENLTEDAGLRELTARIRQQEKIFDQVLSSSPDPICVLDRMGRFTYVNLAIAQLFDLPQAEILGKTAQEISLPPEGMELFENQREVVFATRRPLTDEISYPTINGVRHYEYILSPILGNQNSVEGAICTARDITERKQVEESLRESEANYRHLFEYANDSIFIIDLSTNRILDANQNASRRLGYTRKELLKLKAKDIEAPISEERQKSILQQLQATGSIIFEHALHRKDRSKIQVEVSSRIIEYRDRLVSLSFMRDITKRKQDEERLRLLESAVFNANDAIVITEADPLDKPGPRIVYVNQGFTRMTGYAVEEAIGKTPRFLQGPKTDRAQADVIRDTLARWEPVRAELINYRKDGSEFWVELNIVPIVDDNGNYTHWMAIERDITERKQSETASAKLEKERTSLLAETNAILQEEIAKHQETELALRASEERYGLAVKAGKVGIWDWHIDSGEFYIAPNLKAILRYGEEEIANTIDAWFELIHPDDVTQVKNQINAHLEGLTPQYSSEHRMLCKDGTIRWFLSRGSAIRDGNGKPYRLMGASTDITQSTSPQ